MGLGLIGVAAATFAYLTLLAWSGQLGFKALLVVVVSFACFFAGRMFIGRDARRPVDLIAKIAFTIVGIMALLRHPIEVEGQGTVPVYEAISTYIVQVDGRTFVMWALVAMAVKFVGVIGSAFGWHLLLIGQGIRFPFWQKIMTAFLIGRFIGTFLPSTIGLDSYTLYEAARYSGRVERVLTAKTLEKFIGVTGLFLGMVLTLPLGYSVIVDVTTQAGRPETAPLLAGGIAAIAGGVSLLVCIGLVMPSLLRWITDRLFDIVDWFFGMVPRTESGEGPIGKVLSVLGRIMDRISGTRDNFVDAVGAYEGKLGLLFGALLGKFVTHFTTAMVYFFTALAIGVTTAEFWPVTFGSTIQILATLLSPTIAGEGAREAFQALLLSNQLGGVAQAVLSGALGFIAAEAATLWGGAFLWTRTESWRPTFCEVDGEQVDYAWLADEDDGGFDAERIAAMRRGKPAQEG